MNYIKHQINLFLTALGFFTRIPCRYKYSQENLNQCNRYFPLIGVLVGVISAATYWVLALVLNDSIAVLLSMIVSILVTGAFHEDGFADVCDGFGGGWTKEKILTIMKDSRIGAYGVIGILMLLLLKYIALYQLSHHLIIPALIVAHTLSRSMAMLTMYKLGYVRDDETSKAKPIAKSINTVDVFMAITLSLILIGFLISWWYILIFIPLLLFNYLINRWFYKWIGGYTGDCLGTVQQVSEVLIYLFIIIIATHTALLASIKVYVISVL